LQDAEGGAIVVHMLEDKVVAQRRDGHDRDEFFDGLTYIVFGQLVQHDDDARHEEHDPRLAQPVCE
jgi:hypothetical protein